jgi:hypothetical protein
VAVGEKRATMQAATVEDGDALAEPDDDQVHVGNERIGRNPVGELGPIGDRNLFHRSPLRPFRRFIGSPFGYGAA